MNKYKLLFILSILTLIVHLSGCADKEIKYTANYQDQEWISTFEHISSNVANDFSNLNNTKQNSVSLDNYGDALYYDCSVGLEESKKYKVSPELQPGKDEFEEALSCARDAGLDFLFGALDSKIRRTGESKERMDSANDNVNKFIEHAKNAKLTVDKYESNH